MSTRRGVYGTTLIELIIAIVIAGIMLGGMMSAYSTLVESSADPMVQQQSVLAAKSLMEEILLKPYLDPNTSTICPAPPGTNRAVFDNVCDYNGYSNADILDQAGNTILSADGYSVSVTVVPATAPNALGDIPAARALKIDVSVSNPIARPVTLTAWRTCYESTVCSTL